MAMRIVVGWDGKPRSQDALMLGAQLAEALEARLLIVRAQVRRLRSADSSAAPAETRASLDRALSIVGELAPEVPVMDRVVVAADPASGLHGIASEVDAAIVVIGSTHRGPLGRVLPGATADHLIPDAPCPIAIAPRGYARGDYRPLRLVGLAYDGSDQAKRAAAVATAIAQRGCTGLRVFGVVEPVPVGELGPAIVDKGTLGPTFDEDSLDRELGGLIAELPSRVAGQKVLLHGEPAGALVDQGPHAVDLLVTGSRGHGGLAGGLLGSVTRRLARSAAWPILIVPASAQLGELATAPSRAVEVASA